ncbi:MAG TPA: acyl-CoA dehydrogenase, partial [Rhodobacteraceae bacterium]|nr:acyl-CoA dehydrogenase [Paracoccaceae bacterium]
MTAALLPDLLSLTSSSLPPIRDLLEKATGKLRALVAADGRVCAARIEANQSAAHAYSWLATYVQALEQMQGWAERLNSKSAFGEMEQLILQIAFGEYLGQIRGGIPMSQGEIARLYDIGLSRDDQ